MRAATPLMESLKAEGVENIFGIPGGANLPTYDALVDAGFRHIQVRHEQGGGPRRRGLRQGLGRGRRRLRHLGPGATNLVTAIADAMLDSVPTVFVTGQVRTELIGTDGFQEADILGATLPFVKHSFQVTDPRQIPEYVHEAFHVASTGRPGRCCSTSRRTSRAPTSSTSRAPSRSSCRLQADRARATSNRSGSPPRRSPTPPADPLHRRRRGQRQRLRGAARAGRLRPLPGHLDPDGPRRLPGLGRDWLGMLGMHGTVTANWAMDNADLIVAIGARFDDRITGKLAEFAPHAKVIHIDIDPAEISKNVGAHIPIVGDVKLVLPS
jgi:acetolactate synthase-1/2/3 large subunit